MVKLSFWAREEHLVPIQQVVKRYDLRFGNNPAAYISSGCDGAFVEITFEGTDNERWNAALREIDTIRWPPVPEQPVGWFRRMWMRIFG